MEVLPEDIILKICKYSHTSNLSDVHAEMENKYPTFNHIEDEMMCSALINTHRAITNLNCWEFIKNYKENSFMFSQSIELAAISDECERLGVGHSGSSWGVCMRHMRDIATKGYPNYLKKYSSN